jgi:mRNA interferase RelE/StbE
MSYDVVWDNKAINFLHKLDPFIAKRIIKLVKSFSKDPRTKQFKKLTNENVFRLRAGNYRILFNFNQKTQTINILEIGHRKNIYKN